METYCIFVERETGRQVEWNDEFVEWIYVPGPGIPVPKSSSIDIVPVQPLPGARPVTYEQDGLKDPIEPYASSWPDFSRSS